MRLSWSPLASDDLDSIQTHIAADNIIAAGRIREPLVEAPLQLMSQPAVGRPGKVNGTRELVIARTPYLIVYRVVGDVVELLRVLHGAQDWPPGSD